MQSPLLMPTEQPQAVGTSSNVSDTNPPSTSRPSGESQPRPDDELQHGELQPHSTDGQQPHLSDDELDFLVPGNAPPTHNDSHSSHGARAEPIDIVALMDASIEQRNREEEMAAINCQRQQQLEIERKLLSVPHDPASATSSSEGEELSMRRRRRGSDSHVPSHPLNYCIRAPSSARYVFSVPPSPLSPFLP